MDLSIDAPADWLAQRDLPGTALMLRSPPQGEARLETPAQQRAHGMQAVALQTLSAGESALDFAARCERDLGRLLTDFTVIERTAADGVGHSWTHLVYTFAIGQFIWRQELLTTVIDHKGICMTVSSDDAHFTTWRPTFAAMLASLDRSHPVVVPR